LLKATGGGSIVLMSDGETTMGRPDAQAAADAQRRGIKVNTIAFGTDQGRSPSTPCRSPSLSIALRLRAIADASGGEAFEADSAEKIVSVFEDLGHGVGTRTEPREITDTLALAALLTAAAAAAGSLAWFARIP
jgi:Ca-activated chloride channel family protein